MTPSAMMESPVTLVYLLAASHSGSTLLAMLLGSHPEICSVGELKATSLGDIDRYRCSCRELIGECPFWNGIRDDMSQKGFEFHVGDGSTNFTSVESRYAQRLLKPLHRGPFLEMIRDVGLSISSEWRKRYREISVQNLVLMECISKRTGKRLIVDSSKVGSRLRYLLRIPSLDIRVVRLIRDGRGVALTYTNSSEFADARDASLRGGGMGEGHHIHRLSMQQAAREWRRSNEEAEEIVARLDPSRYLEVRYENVCIYPELELGRVFRFLGVKETDVRGRFKNIEHHVVGNGMRLDSTQEIMLDERWRSTLSDEDKRTFERVAGDLNRSFGYHD